MTQPLMPIEHVGAKRTGIHAGRQKYSLDEPGRRLIQSRYDGTSERIDELAQRLHVPRWKIKNWAGQMGLARQKEPPWTARDVAYLENYLHIRSLGDIAKDLGRTRAAVQLKAKRMGVRKREEGYTMTGVCQGLGCDHNKVKRWVQEGWITATRRQTERTEQQGGDIWYFSDTTIRTFIRNHPEEIDLRRVDKYWFLDIVFGDEHGLGELENEHKEEKLLAKQHKNKEREMKNRETKEKYASRRKITSDERHARKELHTLETAKNTGDQAVTWQDCINSCNNLILLYEQKLIRKPEHSMILQRDLARLKDKRERYMQYRDRERV